jgi:hypothetical protein
MPHLQKPRPQDKPPCFSFGLVSATLLTVLAILRHPREAWRLTDE